ncbi:carbonic anhydrase [Haloferax namakaokahaiae]|uniref:carbonic anhydrase n=1 Tax=Haloferax namakaokahaiae TaxID=1748331 RepID=A0ABD5ZGD0_9EURY
MTNSILASLLAGNERHVERLEADHFKGHRGEQHPRIVSIGCSDSRVAVEAVWNIDKASELFKSVNVGNQAWTHVEGELVVNDAVGYAVSSLGVSDIVVLGHTGCGAVAAAFDAVNGEGPEEAPPAVEAAISRLVPLVEEARELDIYDAQTPRDVAINRLVEYAVVRQVVFLDESPEVPIETNCWGFVYDFQRAYGDDDGVAYLVAANGDSNTERLTELVPERFASRVKSIR